jgi:nicotinamidase/pyrazinamidase
MSTPSTTIKRKALLLIDLQFDFLEGGTLAVPHANQVLTPISKMADGWETIICSQDWHPERHCSFASAHPGARAFDTIIWEGSQERVWPDHCIQNSPGARIHPDILALNPEFIVQKGTDEAIDSYSAFFDNQRRRSTALHGWLQEKNIGFLRIAGLATDYCVRFTVEDALSLGYQVEVWQPGCRAVNAQNGDEDQAWAAMAAAGAILISGT